MELLPSRLRSVIVFAWIAIFSFPPSAQEQSFFSKTEASECALIGILYDLKQTQNLSPLHMDTRACGEVIDNFIGIIWDETVLNKYYRVMRPLFTTQIFIPLIGERADGVYCAFLLIQKKGETYGAPVDGAPLLPVFQLAPFDTPQPEYPRFGPMIAPNGPIWKGYH